MERRRAPPRFPPMRTPRAGCCLTAALVVLVVAACSDSSGPTDGGPVGGSPKIKLIGGFDVTDTAAALLKEPLVVEVRDSSGAVAPQGTVVRFTTLLSDDGTLEVTVQSLESASEFAGAVEALTDAAGRAQISVKLGHAAGPARLIVAAPTIAAQDTARYTVLPGNAAVVRVSPRDTTLYAGRSLTLRGSVTDRYGNIRSEPVTYTVSAPGVSVSNSGVVSASAIGRYTVTITSAAVDNFNAAEISVVPQGTMASAANTGVGQKILSVALDGSNLRYLADWISPGVSPQPRWIPGTDRIIYSTYNGTYQVLRIVDQNGSVTPFIASPPPTMTHQAEPAPSLIAPVMYFSAFDTRCSTTIYCLHRSGRDGSAPELLGTLIGPDAVAGRPSSSPDGLRVAFVTTGPIIKVFDYASKTVLPWSVPGQRPSWSPDGSRIAFVPEGGGPLHLINAADGSGDQVLTPPDRTYMEASISWSSDSKWLLAKSNAGVLDLIEVATGKTLPLGYTEAFQSGSLK